MVDILHCFPTQRRHIDARARDEGVSARGRHRLDTPNRPWVSLDTAQLPRQPFLLSMATPSFPLAVPLRLSNEPLLDIAWRRPIGAVRMYDR